MFLKFKSREKTFLLIHNKRQMNKRKVGKILKRSFIGMKLFREELEKWESLCLSTLQADGKWARMGNRIGPRKHNCSDN